MLKQLSDDPEIWETKYLRIAKMIEKPKTSVYGVFSRSSSELLGSIYWHFPWRQYVFEPLEKTIWNRGCLEMVKAFLQMIMDARKK
jgi:hypothetical protein